MYCISVPTLQILSTCTYSCSVSDTLDDVLKISKEKPKRKPKPAIKAKPLGLSLFEEDTSANLSKMGTDDITKYIQQNQSKDDDDNLDLFN